MVRHDFEGTWNDKHLDYEIETTPLGVPYRNSVYTWNDKHLDYEIETGHTYITDDFGFTWNDKHLDYEIETFYFLFFGANLRKPEMTSISITRLKHDGELYIYYESAPELTSISIARLKH